MLHGTVTSDLIPTVPLPVAGQSWSGTIDTGFNGFLELPDALRPHVNPRFIGRVISLLAGGQQIEEDAFLVDFPFDGAMVLAEATFVTGPDILVGTAMQAQHRLEVNFPNKTVLLERVP